MKPYGEWLVNPVWMTRIEKKKASRLKWKFANPDKVKAARKKWREANPDKVKQHAMKTRTKHIKAVREKANAKAREFRKTPEYRVKKQLDKENFHRKRELLAGRPKPPKCEMINCNKTDVVYDHDHVTNSFRGWPCNHCNVVLGLVGDNPDLLRELADYLEKFASQLRQEAA